MDVVICVLDSVVRAEVITEAGVVQEVFKELQYLKYKLYPFIL